MPFLSRQSTFWRFAPAIFLAAMSSHTSLAQAQTPAAPPAAPLPSPASVRPLPVPPSDIVARHGQLSVKGNRIVDQHGQPVALRGMSLFWSQWIGQYYNPDAVKWLQSDWNATVVRAALGIAAGGYLENPEAEKARIIAVVDAAIERGIYVIIDWHDHEAHLHLPQAKAFFAEMAQRYGKYPNVIYEPFNEPLQNVTWSKDIKPYHAAIIETIRQYDPDNLVICGTRVWSQRVDEAADDPLPYSNVAYTLHYYAASHKQWLRDTAQKALDKGVAIMVTEFGTSEASGNGVLDEVETRKWFDFMEANSISWCNWSVADKNETSAALRPGAPANGGWTDDQISRSGLLIRAEMRAKNSVKTPFAPVVQPMAATKTAATVPTKPAPTKPVAAKPAAPKPTAKVQPKPTSTRGTAR